ncbi:MAG TPA: mandelate racemase/muconate lactonizing enzyme family protein, partial [Burkholderiaceae bacterium]|nr:mandelate racemase/muconate lactonizing enzyme family protein [Burkholderiaceae bacterium]
MKLESIKTFVVGNPPPSFGGKYFVFVKIRTACGIEGVGEAYAATFSPHVITAMAQDLFERVFAGQDPMETETLWRKAYGAGFTLRPDVSLMGVLSALEMACWDITGKALEQPVY